jgi:hypothetical protein
MTDLQEIKAAPWLHDQAELKKRLCRQLKNAKIAMLAKA